MSSDSLQTGRSMAKSKRGRPRWVPPPLEKVEAMAQRGLSYRQIAAALGINHETLATHRRENADFERAIERGRAQGCVALANAGYDLAIISKDGAMIRFLLATVAGFKSANRLEITGEDGDPVQMEASLAVAGKVRLEVDLGRYLEAARRAAQRDSLPARTADDGPGGEEARALASGGAGEPVDP